MNNGKICVSVCAATADDLVRQIRRAAEFADVIEVRFDCLRSEELTASVDILERTELQRPIIATCRSSDQGGRSAISLKDRVRFWQNDSFRFWGCDLDEDIAEGATDCQVRIASYHDFAGVPDDLEERYRRLKSTGADAVKMAAFASDATDAIGIWKILEYSNSHRTPYIPVAMGDAGKWTRILGLAHGAFVTYASLDAGNETADGQVTAVEMAEVYRVKELDENTTVYGVIGDPIAQSLSPFMHNPAFVDAKINAVFIPLLVKDLGAFVRRMVRPQTREVELNFGGFSVTMPHKQAIIEHLDAIDADAEKIGAVNTVKIENGKLTGYNTDAIGFITPLKARFGDLKNAKVAVFGAGGAARACVFALTKEGADVTVYARDVEKAKTFGQEFGVNVGTISKFIEQRSQRAQFGCDIVVDATPYGMKGKLENESLFTANDLMGVKFVFDLVTTAADTPLITQAKAAGISAIGGLEMLIAQGAKQFEIWTEQKAPVDLMRTSLLQRMQS